VKKSRLARSDEGATDISRHVAALVFAFAAAAQALVPTPVTLVDPPAL
jgi:hypothetical protein